MRQAVESILAVARLTRKAALRFRLVPVMIVILIGSVLLLPAVIKDDGTARGMTQIVLSYTLTLTTALLGIMTLWLGCGALAKDVEDATIQLVDVKPITRWQIWLGKWVGVMQIDLFLLAIAAAVIYMQLMWRASRMPPKEQEVLRNEVFVARGSFKPKPPDIEAQVEKIYQQRLEEQPELVQQANPYQLKKLIREQVKSTYEILPPAYVRRWVLNMSSVQDKVKGQPLFLRVKFHAAKKKEEQPTFPVEWRVGPPESPRQYRAIKSMAPDAFHELTIPPDLLDSKGRLIIEAINLSDTALVFPIEDGIEVLYREGGFLLNYIRGVIIVFCWLALIGAMGLAAASYLSFPTATFVSISLLVVAFSTGTMKYVIETGSIFNVNPQTGKVMSPTLFDVATVLFFKTLLFLVNLVRGFSPIDLLSTGRSVTWGMLFRAIGQIVVLLGGIFALIGIVVFSRRELATAQR